MMNTNVTVLLIDDKQDNIFALEQLLEKQGRVFLSARTGNDGLKIALNQEVDLIILDVQMPEMDGFEVAQILKSNKRTKDIPIIFASAEKKEKQSIMQGFEEGAVDYLSKPLDAELTKAKVSVLLKIQLQKRELIEKNIALEKADIQIKQLNADLKKNLQQLEVANKEMESFSYSISHDLRAPVRALIGFASILEEDLKPVNEGARRSIDRIKHNSLKMNGMIENLLELSKMSRREISKSEVDMNALVQAALKDLDTSASKTQIIVHTILPVIADSSLLSHVWTNLISNAIKYSSKKEDPKVEIGSNSVGHEIIYYVKDNGAGFDTNYSQKLFEVFQRLHKASEFEGTGVGLAVVKRIVQRHGGRIWAEAKVGEGAVFYFSLPQEGINAE